MKIDRKELIKRYVEFFKTKKHKEVQNSSLIPENDPTVLFTTAGMHPLVPYLLGQPHPLGKRLVNVQRCIRTVGLYGKKLGNETHDVVGDSYHHTFFEMLGNWSLGDYFKKEAIEYTFEFFTEILKMPIERLAVTCFAGDKNSPKDEESAKIWESLGFKKERIAFLPEEDNWWGPAGKTGPCGPSTEIFYWKLNDKKPPKVFNPEDKNWVEIGNDVLMQYTKNEQGQFNLAKQKNIDFGGGVERTLAVLNGFDDNYLTDCFSSIIKEIERISGKKYGKNADETKAMRIIADHLKASAFIIADGISPGNTEQGYILRRLIRRSIKYGKDLGMNNFTKEIAKPIFEIYSDYTHLQNKRQRILDELEAEENKFMKTIEDGMREFEKMIACLKCKEISGKDAFLLYQSYGFPLEMILEMAKEKKFKVNEKAFAEEFEKHQELSRTASAGVFKSGLADNSEATTKLHTAAHMLMAALRVVLKNPNIMQKGSNITPERLRMDFNFDRKLTEEEIKKVEDLVNSEAQKSCEVIRIECSPEQAKKEGAIGVFENKYGEKVSVYSIGKFSKEICAGPHVKNTCELGKFKIQKEESSSAGVRRIKAILE